MPALVDFAAMRDTVKRLGGDPAKINPIAPADLVIDHSVQVDVFRRYAHMYAFTCKLMTSLMCSDDALEKNQEKEFQRNKERFQFLKWGAKAFRNMQIVPPGSGIVHQVSNYL